MGPVTCHTGDQIAVRILCEQAFDKVAGVITVGRLVIVNIVQSCDIEVVDHGVCVGTAVIYNSLSTLSSLCAFCRLSAFSALLSARSRTGT